MIERIREGLYWCRCERKECRHEWPARKPPRRCAGCKYLNWNGADRRFKSGHPPGAEPKIGRPASKKAKTLQLFVEVKQVLEQLIHDLGPCDHSKNECICHETALLAKVNEQIANLSPRLVTPEAKGTAVASS